MHIRTPLIKSDFLSQQLGAEVWLKMEPLQPVGSFKIRGIGFACRRYMEEGATAFVSSSGGNAGLAVAYAARQLGLPATVVVPESTTPRAIELIRRENAQVIIHGRNWNEAHEHALSLSSEEHPLIHPYDDPLIWEGHSSLVDELVEDWAGPAPDGMLVAVGGGGLLCGVMQGLERHDWTSTRVVAVETHGAASLNAALEAGKPVSIAAIDSIATSLGARQVADQAFTLAQKFNIQSVTVSDAAAVHACLAFLNEHRCLVEPACGAALAPVLERSVALQDMRRVVMVVCGGVGVTVEKLQEWTK